MLSTVELEGAAGEHPSQHASEWATSKTDTVSQVAHPNRENAGGWGMRSGAGLAGVLGRPALPPALPDGSTGGATTSGVACCAAGAAAEVGWAPCSSGTQKRTCGRGGASK